MKHADIIQKLNLEQKCALLSGETVFTRSEEHTSELQSRI